MISRKGRVDATGLGAAVAVHRGAACWSPPRAARRRSRRRPPTTSTRADVDHDADPRAEGTARVLRRAPAAAHRAGHADQVGEGRRSPGVHGTVYRVMYVSETVDGKPVAVTGLIIVPEDGAARRRVPGRVTWGHGTNGMADSARRRSTRRTPCRWPTSCSTRAGRSPRATTRARARPGSCRTSRASSAARNTIDIVRAARDLPAAHASDRLRRVGSLRRRADRDVRVEHRHEVRARAEAARASWPGAPPSQFALHLQLPADEPVPLLPADGGGRVERRVRRQRAPLDQVLTPAGMKLLPMLDKGCAGVPERRSSATSTSSKLSKGDPFKVPAWRKVLEANDPQDFATREPGAAAHDPGRQRRADPRRVDAAARPAPVRDPPGARSGGSIPGQSHAGVIDAVVGRHDALDRRPIRGRHQPRSVQADRPSRRADHDVPELSDAGE